MIAAILVGCCSKRKYFPINSLASFDAADFQPPMGSGGEGAAFCALPACCPYRRRSYVAAQRRGNFHLVEWKKWLPAFGPGNAFLTDFKEVFQRAYIWGGREKNNTDRQMMRGRIEMKNKEQYEKELIFPIGRTNDDYQAYFDGQSYLASLSEEQVVIHNITFEPGCRNHWHSHRALKGGGQMLICVGGRGYYQEWGKEAVLMMPGSVVHIPANVKHWHGAAADSWFSHLSIGISGEGVSTEWLEAVSEEDYSAVHKR